MPRPRPAAPLALLLAIVALAGCGGGDGPEHDRRPTRPPAPERAADEARASFDGARRASAAQPATRVDERDDDAGRLARRARDLAADSVASWSTLQLPDGRFRDPLSGGRATTGYGRVMLGYGLLRAGLLRDREPLWVAGARALARRNPPSSQSFRALGMLAALERVPVLPRTVRRETTRYLRGFQPTSAKPGEEGPAGGHQRDRRPYSNLKLVEATSVAMLLRTGLRSTVAGTRLADRATSRAFVRSVVGPEVARAIGPDLRARGADGRITGGILSDSPTYPLAYHALSTWALARTVRELGPAAPPAARRSLRRALDALTVLMAPDGQVAWYGRGQSQVWVPAIAAAAAAEGARAFAADRPLAGRLLAVVDRALTLLRDRYRQPDGRLLLVDRGPGAAERRDMVGIDHYAGNVVYGGLAAYGLFEALDALAALPEGLRSGPLPADGDLRVVDGRTSHLAVVRRGPLWFAVHGIAQHRRDLRYDFGLLRLERRDGDGWRDALRPRPITLTGDARTVSAGPQIVVGGEAGYPVGERIDAAADGTVTVRGGFRTRAGGWLARGVVFRWQPRGTVLRMTVSGLPRSATVLRTTVYAPPASLRAGGSTVVAEGLRVRFAAPVRTAIRGRFHNAPDRDLAAAVVRVAPRDGRVVVDYETG
ncbi:hypothetical protein [Patulibacter defluvii]|uniref:hypothetical protein n=1 Tax=Patulibacter defluvii TaxID=3095358 RepID=UPI002A75D48B|nr:hypothetical protein [Patulibacter sp. DM4]